MNGIDRRDQIKYFFLINIKDIEYSISLQFPTIDEYFSPQIQLD